MDKKLIVLFTLIVGLVLVGMKSQQKGHNLITQEEAEAFTLFTEWRIEHNRRYRQDQETSYRFMKFFQNFKFVKDHNKRYAQGLQTFDVKLNKFADLDNIEFSSLFKGLKKKNVGATSECKGEVQILSDLPASVNWEDKAVGSVKNQGMCGSCWAFSACGALEGVAAIKTGKIPNFAPQQLVDCAGGPYENEGCNGGQMDSAFWYVIDNGITTEAKYPYKAKDQKCAYKPTMKEFSISSCAEVPANKAIALQSAVAKQPVSISVEADTLYFQFYSKGVFSSKKCGTDLDHGIVLAGYGTLDGKDYWNCKNSWGADWGMKGYILIERTDEDGPGMCGIMMDNTVPFV